MSRARGVPCEGAGRIVHPQQRRARRPVVRTVAAAALATIMSSLPVFLLGGLSVLAREDLAFGEVQLGLGVSLFFTMSALTSLPVGHLVQRVGAWVTTLSGTGLSAAALVVMASAQSYGWLLVGLAAAGLGNSLSQIGSNDALARVVPRHRQGLAFGVKQAAVPAATLVAGLAVPLVGLALGWRIAFAAAAAFWLANVAVTPRSEAGVVFGGRTGRRGDAPVQPMIVIAVAAALGAAAANTLTTFLVVSSVDAGMTAGRAGLLLAAGSCCGIVMRLLAGWRADSSRGPHLTSVAAMLAVGGIGMALLATREPLSALPGTAIAFGMGWSWPGLLNFAVVRLNPLSPAIATSFNQTGSFVGGATGPLGFGFLVEHTSYGVAWSCAGGALLAAALLMHCAQRMLSSAEAASA